MGTLLLNINLAATNIVLSASSAPPLKGTESAQIQPQTTSSVIFNIYLLGVCSLSRQVKAKGVIHIHNIKERKKITVKLNV